MSFKKWISVLGEGLSHPFFVSAPVSMPAIGNESISSNFVPPYDPV